MNEKKANLGRRIYSSSPSASTSSTSTSTFFLFPPVAFLDFLAGASPIVALGF